jgi:uncharacterized membrane protein YagU involved in acid resistance
MGCDGDGSSVRDALAGALGGIVGTWAMATANAVWTGLTPVPDDPRRARERETRLRNAGVGAGRHAQSEPRSHQRGISPGERAVAAVARQIAAAPIEPRHRERLGSALHYGFGATAGALYGLLARRWPAAAFGRGTGYGTAVWLVADELVVPAMGIADSPTHTPLRRHAYALVGHWAYGLALDLVRRALSR